MAFSDDGRFLMTTHDARGRLWEVETGRLIGAPIETLASSVPAALPGERVGLLTASERWVEIWNFDVDAWADIACRARGPEHDTSRVGPVRPPRRGLPGDPPPVARKGAWSRCPCSRSDGARPAGHAVGHGHMERVRA